MPVKKAKIDYKERCHLLEDCLYRVDKAIGLCVNRNIYNKSAINSYELIPLEIDTFFKQLSIVSKHSNWQVRAFLDAGCGIGTKVFLALRAGFEWGKSLGIDLNGGYIKIAEKLISAKKCDILKFKDYNKFDVVYYYCPFQNREFQEKFEELVENKIKVGAYIIANLKKSQNFEKDKRFKIVEKGCDYSHWYILKKIKE